MNKPCSSIVVDKTSEYSFGPQLRSLSAAWRSSVTKEENLSLQTWSTESEMSRRVLCPRIRVCLGVYYA